MKFILLVLIGFSCRHINARLIEKITDRALTTETKTTGSSPPVRLTREVYEEDSIIGSKEDNVESDEQVRPSNKKMKHFSKSKLRTDESTTLIRVPRESHEKIDKSKKNTTTTLVPVKHKNTLVNKPIPKYNEMDYDDDFQMKIIRSPVGVADSSEHEDEDFNVDDYDFDVNHDEFIGRGKPLEPRQKTKANHERSHAAPKHPAPRSEASKSSATHRPVSNKKERAAEYIPKKSGEKEDYYDDTTTTSTTTKVSEKRESEDEFNDENEESKEFENKGSPASVRTIRSPLKLNAHVDKLGKKGSPVLSKVLSILPMFPQVPNKKGNVKFGLSIDPWVNRA